MTVVARTRTRAVAPVALPKPEQLTFGYPVVGGPKHAMAAGFPIFTDGRPIDKWPFRAGVELIGYRLTEFQHTRSKAKLFHCGTDIVPVAVHAWQLRDGSFRYMGRFADKDRAVGQVELARSRASVDVQPVAPRSRIRRVRQS